MTLTLWLSVGDNSNIHKIITVRVYSVLNTLTKLTQPGTGSKRSDSRILSTPTHIEGPEIFVYLSMSVKLTF